MDHHCPWIANCVGLKNQKYFYQFLFFATLGDLIGFIILSKTFFNLTSNGVINLENKKVDSVLDIIWALWSEIMILISMFISIAMTLSIGLLFYFQTKLILNNSTSIEYKIDSNHTKSPWFYEDKLHNFKIVMGDTIFEWILPVFEINTYNNGFNHHTPKNKPEFRKELDNKDYMRLGDLEINITNENIE